MERRKIIIEVEATGEIAINFVKIQEAISIEYGSKLKFLSINA